jgi:hypothetical protein
MSKTKKDKRPRIISDKKFNELIEQREFCRKEINRIANEMNDAHNSVLGVVYSEEKDLAFLQRLLSDEMPFVVDFALPIVARELSLHPEQEKVYDVVDKFADAVWFYCKVMLDIEHQMKSITPIKRNELPIRGVGDLYIRIDDINEILGRYKLTSQQREVFLRGPTKIREYTKEKTAELVVKYKETSNELLAKYKETSKNGIVPPQSIGTTPKALWYKRPDEKKTKAKKRK